MRHALEKEELLKALHSLGITTHDTIFVHSDLRVFGFPKGVTTREELLDFYLQTLLKAVGEKGTIAVPAYYYGYARYGKPFDVEESPVSLQLGSLSQHVASLKEAVRSCNPIQSIAAIGEKAELIARGSSLNGYGVTSPWQRLLEANAKFLFLGAPLQAMTFVHHVEQLVGVPHLYFKMFETPILKGGKKVAGHAVSAVRYLDFSITYDLSRFHALLKEKGQLHTHQIGKATLLSLSFSDAYSTAVSALTEDPFFFLEKPPQFIPGTIPFDGATEEVADGKG